MGRVVREDKTGSPFCNPDRRRRSIISRTSDKEGGGKGERKRHGRKLEDKQGKREKGAMEPLGGGLQLTKTGTPGASKNTLILKRCKA